MLYLIVMLSGAILGFVLLVATGLPVVALRCFHCLPLDRRLWWTLAALVAARCVHQIALGEHDYAVPTGNEQLAAFNALRFGGFACIALVWLAGFIALYRIGSKSGMEPVSKLTWPVAGLVILAGVVLSIDHSDVRRQKMEDRQSEIVAVLKSGNLEKLQQLFDEGERLHQPFEELGNREPFRYAIQQQDIEMIRLFMSRPEPHRPHLEVWMGSMMSTGNREIIDILVDAHSKDPEFLGHALNVAVIHEAPEAFQLLLSKNADPNYMYNYTALMTAAQRNLSDYAVALIDAGANVDAVHQSRWGKTNRTALSFAAEKGHIEMIKLLLSHNADPSIADEDGKLPIDWARSFRHPQIVDLLGDMTDSNENMPQQPLNRPEQP